MASTTESPAADVAVDEQLDTDKPWIVLVWNDPINLMSYVAFVLQKLFGYSLYHYLSIKMLFIAIRSKLILQLI